VKRARSSALALLLALGGCGGKAATYEYTGATGGDSSGGGGGTSSASGTSQGGAASANDGGSAGRDADGGASGTSGTSSGEGGASAANGGAGGPLTSGGRGGTAGEGEAAGASGTAGSSSAGGAAGAGGAKACISVTECPRPVNACLIARCSAGACVADYAPAGALYALDAPADCHATTACDGLGHATLAVDQSNAPIPANQCLVGTCNDSGTVGSEPLPSGTPCHADAGGGKCNGQGTCVACLVTADCPLGQTCNSNQECIGQACSDSHCGGACPACVVGQVCARDNDCSSHACDLATLRCVVDRQCADGRQNGNETDEDCGGGVCPRCRLGQACLGDTDCASSACDAISLTCVADTCSDHRMDSDESDVDCGGSNASCSRCGVAKKCTSNIDCPSGHVCNASKVCQ
jgi:hypothetical protein